MNKKLVSALILLSLSIGSAQASVVASTTITGVHEDIDTNVNTFETYYFKANTASSLDVYLLSQPAKEDSTFNMDGFLSVWQQSGNNWVLVAANDDAARPGGSGPTTVYGQPVFQYNAVVPALGVADPGLTFTPVANATYMVVQSEKGNGPSGSLGQLLAINASVQSALLGKAANYNDGSLGVNNLGFYDFHYDYQLILKGNVSVTNGPVSSVPVPSAIWLFATGLFGLRWFGRKKV